MLIRGQCLPCARFTTVVDQLKRSRYITSPPSAHCVHSGNLIQEGGPQLHTSALNCEL